MPNQEEKGLRVTISQAAIIGLIIIAALGWGWNVERRMASVESTADVSKRVKKIENALLSIATATELLLVDYKVRQELEKNRTTLYQPPGSIPTPDELLKTAEDWAQKQIPNKGDK